VPSGETIRSCRQAQSGEAGAQVGQRPVSSNGLARSGDRWMKQVMNERETKKGKRT
jgi:hypothetical protein